jgi:hypothetical protein
MGGLVRLRLLIIMFGGMFIHPGSIVKRILLIRSTGSVDREADS